MSIKAYRDDTTDREISPEFALITQDCKQPVIITSRLQFTLVKLLLRLGGIHPCVIRETNVLPEQ